MVHFLCASKRVDGAAGKQALVFGFRNHILQLLIDNNDGKIIIDFTKLKSKNGFEFLDD
jgi:hypothetical protein